MFKGTVEKGSLLFQVDTMEEARGIRSALDGKMAIHYVMDGARFALLESAVPQPAQAKTSAPKEPRTKALVAKPIRPGDWAPPAVEVLMKTIMERHARGLGHTIQDLIKAHTKGDFPEREGQMVNIYIQWIRRAQAARIQLERQGKLRFVMEGNGKNRRYTGQSLEGA